MTIPTFCFMIPGTIKKLYFNIKENDPKVKIGSFSL